MNKGIFERFDLLLLLVTIAVIICGLFAIFSATYTSGTDYFTKQLYFSIIGIILMVGVSFIPPGIIARSSYIIYGLSIVLLVVVLIIGKKISGSRSWFSMGGFGIQPSEFAKIATILALANFLSQTEDGFRNVNKFSTFFKASAIVLIPVLLVMKQPDMGTSLVFLSMILPVLFWVGLSPYVLFIIITPVLAVLGAFFGVNYLIGAIVLIGIVLLLFKKNMFVAACVIVLNIGIGYSFDTLYHKLQPYQQKRITAVFDPASDPLGSGYNVIQSKVAIGSGGLFGKGFLQGTQTQLKFIPEQWTDFIFCMIGEEFGFTGSIIILALYITIILRLVNNAYLTKNRFLSVACIGFGSIIMFHLVINVGMTIGIMPVIGIPLPMMSYGLSSLLSFLVMMGIAMSAYRYRNQY